MSMMLQQRLLPYEIRKTACELFAGKTGFTSEEMKAFFTEEIRKAVPPPPDPSAEDGFWSGFSDIMGQMYYEQKLRPSAEALRRRADLFEYWLSLLPLQNQKELLLELCHKPDFPMSRGKPSQQRRNQLVALLTSFVIGPHVSSVLQSFGSTYVMNTWQKGNCSLHRWRPTRCNHSSSYPA